MPVFQALIRPVLQYGCLAFWSAHSQVEFLSVLHQQSTTRVVVRARTMGVHELWSILEPVRESVPLFHLTGKTLAVDLSLWVCEAQSVKEMVGRVTKPHLRNLFFRVSSLTQMGIKLIFIMEGEAPKLKAETMCKRSQMRFGPSKKAAPKTGRSRFKAVLKECAVMLDCLGIPWATAAGEAEAMCAYLDSLGLVDGCITNDGDAFLYGAQTVYRNFNMNTKDPQVDCYKTAKIKSELHLERETLVGLAILLGCDYIPKGIPGVGKEQTLKLIKALNGQTLLQKFTQWQGEGQEIRRPAVKKVTHCLVCHHPGSAKTHERSGCSMCGSKHFCVPQDYDYSCPCDWHRIENAQHGPSVEANVKRKTLASDGFPFTEIINEFLVSKDRPVQNVTRRKPNLLLMQNFALEKMEWPKSYTSEKVLVLLTYTELMNRKCGRGNSTLIQPIRVFKPRVRGGIASFEIIWKKPDHYVFAEDHGTACRDTVRTVEEEALFVAAYPDIVDQFLKEREEAQENKLKQKKRSKKKDKEPDIKPDDVSDLFSQLAIDVSAEVKAGTLDIDTAGIVAVVPADTRDAQGPLTFPRASDEQGRVREKCHDLTAPQGFCMRETEHCPSPAPSQCVPAPEPSLSVSAVIDELHLSDIDWEAMSFSSAPSPRGPTAERTAPNQRDDLTPVRGTSSSAESISIAPETGGLAGIQLSVFHTLIAPKPHATASLSTTSLRERVLSRNAIMSSSTHADTVTTHTQQPKAGSSIQCTAAKTTFPSAPPKDSGDVMLLKQQEFHVKNALPSDGKKAARVQNSDPISPKRKTPSLETQRVAEAASTKPLSQSRCAGKNGKVKMSSGGSSDQAGHKGRRVQAVKKSVCVSVCSSSENSDAENRQVGEHRKTVKSKGRKRSPYLTDYTLKPNKAMGPGPPAAARTVLDSLDIGPQALHSEQHKSGCASIIERHLETVDDGDVFVQSPVSGRQVNTTQGDDSVISVDSPLPLAERLKLKFK
ncbi:hypothetical protein AAFF_G00241730 [Aldrovandia affinis]|uniref:Flap endonuclease GEN homolog 1 n=1 Tax=Aldrovandia affinis TaxID=143900 RepID=A0AAD7WTZ1_9TELE|nr:hypothetical protein AAFF_G00241730 [Aldrovandia affinis]